MSLKPTERQPTFATSGTGISRTVDPGSTYQADGMQVNERPPAGFLNWYNHSNGEWHRYMYELTTELRNCAGVDHQPSYVLTGLKPILSGLTASIQIGAALFYETSPSSGEPIYQPVFSLGVNYPLPLVTTSSVNEWASVFAQRNSTTGVLEITSTHGTATNIPQPSAEQVLLAVYRNGVLYDAREFVRPDLRAIQDDDAEYLDNSLTFNAAGDLIIKSRVVARAASQALGSEYVLSRTVSAATLGLFVDDLAALSPSTNYYVYVCKSHGKATPVYSGTGNAFPVLSTTPPASGKRMRTFAGSEAGLAFSNYAMPANAVLVGVIRRNAANTAFEQWTTHGDEVEFSGNDALFATNPLQLAALVLTGTSTASIAQVPQSREYCVQVRVQMNPTLNAQCTFEAAVNGGPTHFRTQFVSLGGFNAYSEWSHPFWSPAAPSVTYTATATQTADQLATLRITRARF